MPSSAFITLIPARLESTRLPNKPLLDLAGQPMIVRVAKQAQSSGAQAVIVATDSTAIVEVCQQAGIKTVLTDKHHPSGTDRLAQAADILEIADDTLVVNLQGDEPLVHPELLANVADHLQQHPECVMATAAHPIEHADDIFNPNIVKVVCDKQQRALYFSRAPIPWSRTAYQYQMSLSEIYRHRIAIDSHQTEPTALRHIGLYAYRASFLKKFPTLASAPCEMAESLEQLRVLWHGERIAVFITPNTPQAGIDTQEDLERVRQLLFKSV